MRVHIFITAMAMAICLAGSACAAASGNSTQNVIAHFEQILSGKDSTTRTDFVKLLARELSKNCQKPSAKYLELLSGA
jgi:hypothetical protein